MTVDLRAYRFYFHDSEKGSNVEKEAIYDALAPRVGDINLDGYPDILLRMQSPGSLKVKSEHSCGNFTNNFRAILKFLTKIASRVGDINLVGYPDIMIVQILYF